jgi:hypothetical protein
VTPLRRVGIASSGTNTCLPQGIIGRPGRMSRATGGDDPPGAFAMPRRTWLASRFGSTKTPTFQPGPPQSVLLSVSLDAAARASHGRRTQPAAKRQGGCCHAIQRRSAFVICEGKLPASLAIGRQNLVLSCHARVIGPPCLFGLSGGYEDISAAVNGSLSGGTQRR